MSNNLLFLNEKNFSLQEGKKGNVLCCNTRGVTLILFYSKSCPHCSEVLPTFQTLPKVMPNCQFGMLNISNNMKVAQMSSESICPIEYVPFIILYINGRPFMKYTGPKTLEDIANFLNDVLSRLNTKKNFNVLKIDNQESEIPPYSVGVPFNLVCEGEQCYLNFSEAYKK
jgi:thioredoxin-like negative regulator of GroEL